MSSPSSNMSKAQKKARKAVDARGNTGLSTGSAPPIPADIDKGPQALVQLACKLSLDTGMYVDTRFFVFSSRNPSGTVSIPRAVYANSWILRAKLSSYFEPLLRGGYEGNSVVGPLQSPFPQAFSDRTDSYDYDSDSDLDDEDEDTTTTIKSSSPERLAKEDEKEPQSPDDGSTSALGTGQTLLMRNCAYPTWKAFIFYLYTGEVSFLPLTSQAECPAAEATGRRPLVASPPQCSPKSMYRLADELGFEELRKKAEDDIKAKLTVDNILEELFSTITSRYNAIRELEINFACTTASQVVSSKIAGFMATIEAEHLKRSSEVLSHLISKLAASPIPSLAKPRPSTCPNCARANPSIRCQHCNYNLP